MEIVLFYVGVGRPEYRIIAAKAIKRIRQLMPAAQITLLTDLATPPLDEDVVIHRLNNHIGSDKICYFRGLAQAEYAIKAKEGHKIAFMDVDVILERPLHALFDIDFEVGLMWRDDFAGQQINTGLILARGGERGHAFWEHYKNAVSMFGKNVSKAWWADQYPFSTMIGIDKNPGKAVVRATQILGAKVAIYRMNNVVPAHEDVNMQFAPNIFARHYKGARKLCLI